MHLIFYILLIIILSIFLLSIPFVSEQNTTLLFIPIFYWTLHKPTLCNQLIVFIIGLLYDLIMSFPLGISCIILLFLHSSVEKQRRFIYNKSFMIIYWSFVIISFPPLIIQWSLGSIIECTLLPIQKLIVEYLVTILFFPIFIWMINIIKIMTLFIK